jgi:penicillin V acylase-like amidase (Ntn superfamily)
VRAVAFSQSAVPSDTAQQAVLQAFHILNNFDIPYGAVRQVDSGQMHAEATVWTSASDLKNLRWYFRTYDDQSIRSIDLMKAMDAAHGQIKFIKMSGRQPVTEVSTNFRETRSSETPARQNRAAFSHRPHTSSHARRTSAWASSSAGVPSNTMRPWPMT